MRCHETVSKTSSASKRANQAVQLQLDAVRRATSEDSLRIARLEAGGLDLEEDDQVHPPVAVKVADEVHRPARVLVRTHPRSRKPLVPSKEERSKSAANAPPVAEHDVHPPGIVSAAGEATCEC